MRFLLSLVALAHIALISGAAEKRPMEPIDLLKLDTLSSRVVSPDGEWVAFLLSKLNWKKGAEQTDIFVVKTDGTNRRRMTFTEEHSETLLTWARDSQSIFFLAPRDEKKNQLFRLPLHGGEAERLSDESNGVTSFDVGRDGRWLVYRAGAATNRQLKRVDLSAQNPTSEALTKHETSVESWRMIPNPDRVVFAAEIDKSAQEAERKTKGFDVKINDPEPIAQNLWIVDLESKESSAIATPAGIVVSRITPSRDGRFVAFKSRPSARYSTNWDQELYLITLKTREIRRITNNSQEEDTFEFSPDGEQIAYTAPAGSEQYRATRIFVESTTAGEPNELLSHWKYDGNISFWAPDGKSLYFTTEIGVNGQAFQVTLAGGGAEQITSGEHQLTIDFDHDSQTMLVTRSTPYNPGDLYTAPLGMLSQPQLWSRLTEQAEQVGDFEMGGYETIRWKSSDGAEVEGLLIKPVGYQEGTRYPLIVQIHGGPAGTSMNAFPGRWSTYTHVLAGKGYAVFQPNYRGSSGYGDEFRRTIAGDYFRLGFDDVMAGVDYLIERGVADPDKLAHMGWSAGGHWSNWALTHTDRFKAIASGAGAVNWISMWAQSDTQINREFYFEGKPYENREHYLEVSPITYIKDAKTPTLIMCGTADERVPNPQSRELYMNLQKLGVPVEYIEFPNMPHGLTKPRYQLVKMEAEIAWFAKWIHGAEGWLDWGKILETLPQEKKVETDRP